MERLYFVLFQAYAFSPRLNILKANGTNPALKSPPQLVDEILTNLKTVAPTDFERVVNRLLSQMGYYRPGVMANSNESASPAANSPVVWMLVPRIFAAAKLPALHRSYRVRNWTPTISPKSDRVACGLTIRDGHLCPSLSGWRLRGYFPFPSFGAVRAYQAAGLGPRGEPGVTSR